MHGGYAWSDANFTSAPYIANIDAQNVPLSGRNDNFNMDGGLLGAHLGYAKVNSSNILFGIEADWSNLWGKDSVNGAEVFDDGAGGLYFMSHHSELDLNWQATLRGRLGIVFRKQIVLCYSGDCLSRC